MFSSLSEMWQNYKQLSFTISGMPVYMIGHGLFGERHGLKPSIMKGNVAKVTRVYGVPTIIQVGELVLIHFLQSLTGWNTTRTKTIYILSYSIIHGVMRADAIEAFR